MAASSCTMWFWSDWLGDQEVRRLTPEERGVWIDMLALAAAASPIGYVCDGKGRALTIEEIARVTNASPEAVSKLIVGILEKGVASRDRTGRLFNRRMVRDAIARVKKKELREKRASAGYVGAQQTSLKYFGKQILPRQMPRHSLDTIPFQKNKDSLLPVAAREAMPKPVAKQAATEKRPAAKSVASPELTKKLNGGHRA